MRSTRKSEKAREGSRIVDAADFVAAASTIGISLSPQQWDMVLQYMDALLRWNEKINLTGITVPEEILIKHVLDSMVPVEMIGIRDRVVDLGSGAGFPGIPLKILLKDLRLHLVEATRKKVSFLEFAVRSLGLKGVDVVWSRAEKDGFGWSFPGSPVDVVISRAALKDREVLEVGRLLIGNRGRVILMKGFLTEEDVAKLGSVGKEFFLAVSSIRKYRLPGMARDRNLVVLERTQ